MTLHKLKEELDQKLDGKLNELLLSRQELMDLEKDGKYDNERHREIIKEMISIGAEVFGCMKYIKAHYPQEIIDILDEIRDLMIMNYPK